MKFLSKFADPRLWASLAIATVGISAGIGIGLHRHAEAVRGLANWPQEDREQFAGVVYSYLPAPLYALTLGGIVGAWMLIPEPNQQKRESDRGIVARVARARLASSALSEPEMLHWSSVLSEMEGDTDV